jgi:hypothetical protein
MLRPWGKELDEDKRFLSDSAEIAWGDVNHIGTLRDGDGDKSEGGQGAKEGRELHDGRKEREWCESNKCLRLIWDGSPLATDRDVALLPLYVVASRPCMIVSHKSAASLAWAC